MLAALQALTVLGCALAGFRLRPERALVLLAAVVVLLPAALQLPNGLTPLPTATRITALAVAAGLLRRRERRLFRGTPLHLVAGLYAGTTLVTGVLLAPVDLRLGDTTLAWLGLLDPLLVGLVALACARAAGPRAGLQALALVALVAVAAATDEHVTGSALSRFLVRGDGLERRLADTRVRVGSDFALAFAWTMAALCPAVVVLLRRRSLTLLLGLAGCLAAEYWTFSRSVPLGAALGLLAVVVGVRDRRLAVVVLATVLLVGGVVLSRPALRDRFSAAVDQGALNVRAERAPVVLDAASRHPVRGLGLGGVAQLAVGETDESFLLSYAETGVVGVLVLLVLLGCGLVLCGRGLRGPPASGRTTSAVALAGVLVLVAGAAVFDAFAVGGTAALLGLLLGVGAAAAERVAGDAPIARPARDRPERRVLLVGLSVAAGMVVASVWPSHAVLTAEFETLSPATLTAGFDQVDLGRQLIATACSVALEAPPAGVRVECHDSNAAAGVGALRLQAATSAQDLSALAELVTRVRTRTPVHDFSPAITLPILTGVPTIARTAPWSAGTIALLLVLLVPTEPLRRLQARTRSWTWTVDGSDGGTRPGGLVGASGRVAQQPVQGRAEVLDGGDLQPV